MSAIVTIVLVVRHGIRNLVPGALPLITCKLEATKPVDGGKVECH